MATKALPGSAGSFLGTVTGKRAAHEMLRCFWRNPFSRDCVARYLYGELPQACLLFVSPRPTCAQRRSMVRPHATWSWWAPCVPRAQLLSQRRKEG